MKNRPFYQFIIIFLLLIAGVYVFLNHFEPRTKLGEPGARKSRVPIGGIHNEKHFEQAFTIPPFKESVQRIDIALTGATYLRKNPGSLKIIFTQGDQVLELNKKAARVKNNSPMYFTLSTKQFKPGSITLKIFSEDNPSNIGATFWAFSDQVNEPLILNGEPQAHELVIDYYERISSWTHLSIRMGSVYAALALIMVFCASSALILVAAIQGIKPSKPRLR